MTPARGAVKAKTHFFKNKNLSTVLEGAAGLGWTGK
jgi:hypothetical protein